MRSVSKLIDGRDALAHVAAQVMRLRNVIVVHRESFVVPGDVCDVGLRTHPHLALIQPLFSRHYADIALSNSCGLRRRQDMPPISIGIESSIDARAGAPRSGARPVPPERERRNLIRWLTVAVSSLSLAACAQSPLAGKRTAALSASRQEAVEHKRSPVFLPDKVATSFPVLGLPPPDTGVGAQIRSNGLASFYTEGQQTANGERFDPYAMTAAHRTLPFGTRLRVTNVATGRSVTVRVNDRGPYIKGRVVDLSYSAAMALGMVHAGVANVKLDVVRLASPAKPRHQLHMRRVSELIDRGNYVALVASVDQ
jgi:peptidoglycan lytic transglycosylase